MRTFRCRVCWQMMGLFARSCTHCGHVDAARRAQGLGELAVGLVCGAMVLGLVAWLASRLFFG